MDGSTIHEDKYTHGELLLFNKFFDADIYGLTQEELQKRPGLLFGTRSEAPRPLGSFYGEGEYSRIQNNYEAISCFVIINIINSVLNVIHNQLRSTSALLIRKFIYMQTCLLFILFTLEIPWTEKFCEVSLGFTFLQLSLTRLDAHISRHHFWLPDLMICLPTSLLTCATISVHGLIWHSLFNRQEIICILFGHLRNSWIFIRECQHHPSWSCCPRRVLPFWRQWWWSRHISHLGQWNVSGHSKARSPQRYIYFLYVFHFTEVGDGWVIS